MANKKKSTTVLPPKIEETAPFEPELEEQEITHTDYESLTNDCFSLHSTDNE